MVPPCGGGIVGAWGSGSFVEPEERRRSHETCSNTCVERREAYLWEKLGEPSCLLSRAGPRLLIRQWHRGRDAGLSAMHRSGMTLSCGIFD
jgi:hypothetical protein